MRATHEFGPFFRSDSEILILGSFPSVKSREEAFYYAHPQNRFWRVLATCFDEHVPESIAEKQELLVRRKIAIWDVVTECEIVGSRDATIKNYTVADLENLLKNLQIGLIIVNGGRAHSIFKKHFPTTPATALPSTSPANTRFDKKEWFDALRGVF